MRTYVEIPDCLICNNELYSTCVWRCTECKKNIHWDCMVTNVSFGNNTCPHCRDVVHECSSEDDNYSDTSSEADDDDDSDYTPVEDDDDSEGEMED